MTNLNSNNNNNNNNNKTWVSFTIRCETLPKQRVILSGSIPQLGEWDVNKSVVLRIAEESLNGGNVWNGSISLPQNQKFEYKYAIMNNDGSVDWEHMPNINRVYMTALENEATLDDGIFFASRDQLDAALKEQKRGVSLRLCTATSSAPTEDLSLLFTSTRGAVIDMPTDLQLRFDRVRECAEKYQKTVNKLLQSSRNNGADSLDMTVLIQRAENAEDNLQKLQDKLDLAKRHCSLHSAVDNTKNLVDLLDIGVDVNAKDALGNTALHIATQRQLLDAIRVLLSHNADPNIQNLAGISPITIAVNGSMHVVLEQMASFGVQVPATLGSVKSVSDMAIGGAEAQPDKDHPIVLI